MYKKPINWFLTKRGRSFSHIVLTTAGASFVAAKFLPNTFFLHKYKEFVHHYYNSKPVPLPDELRNRYEKCIKILNISEQDKKIIEPFSVFGFDLLNAGTCASKFGAIIGIPTHFAYRSEEDIDKKNLQVNLKKIDWNTEAGKKLSESLILPDKVQEFAICRELLATRNIKLYLQCFYPVACLTLAIAMARHANRKFNFYEAPAIIRATLYVLISLFTTGLYFMLTDYTEVQYEAYTDTKLVELGPEFIKSGVIFYDKILKRNQALRELMGKEGESKYTINGNENYFIRHPHIALVHRKQFFEKKLKELNETSKSVQ